MALGKGKSDSKGSKGKSSSKGGGKRDNSSKRYIGSVWENDGDKGTYLSLAIDNHDPESEYHKGTLIWQDKETGKYYKVKSAAIYDADKGPKNLMNKIVIDLENDYHVEELESED